MSPVRPGDLIDPCRAPRGAGGGHRCRRDPIRGHGGPAARKTGDNVKRSSDDDESMTAKLRSALAPVVLGLAVLLFSCGRAQAAGGNYVFQGGTAAEQSQVRQPLNASSFHWGRVPGTVTIVIGPTATSEAVPGKIFLDPGLLDSGEIAWGVVQHEYATLLNFTLPDEP